MWLRERSDELDWLHARLEDDASRDTLVRLLVHRLVGSRRVSLGVGRDVSARLTTFAGPVLPVDPPSAGGVPGAATYDLEPIGLELRVQSLPMFAIQTFLLEQYRHPDFEQANVRPGDVVVDGGAFWGDTSLWLAEQSAPDGRVVAFEPDPGSRRVLEANLRANKAHGGRVEVRGEALWDSETRLVLTALGAASTVGDGGGREVRAVTLDALRRDGALARVDFVKLDVEGAELRVLRGASDLIRERPPRLAVAVYHRPEDLVVIPRLLHDLAPAYRFAITHRSLHQFDTMLFAWTDS